MRWRGGVLAGIGGALLLLALALTLAAAFPNLRGMELLVYDRMLRSLPPIPPDPRIVIVGMDEDTPSAVQPDRPFYPLSRKLHGHLVDALRQAGARVIGFDVMFPASRPEDGAFAAALARHGNAVGALAPQIARRGSREEVRFQRPAPALAPHLRAGSILVPVGFGGKARWVLPRRADDSRVGEAWPHLGLALAAAYQGETNELQVRDDVRWGAWMRLPLLERTEGEKALLIRFLGPAGTVPMVPYQEVLSGAWRRRLPPETFRDRIVLVGRYSRQEDTLETPRGRMPGVEALATVTSMALRGDGIAWRASLWPWGALLAGLFLLAVWRLSLLPALGVGALLAGLYTLGVWRYFLTAQVYLETLPPLWLLLAAAVAAGGFELARAGRELAALLPSWAFRRALTGQGVALEMRETPVSVVFCDIRGFTAFAERHTGAQVEALLQRYFAAGDEAARRFGTELDKFIGDAMMLYFAPRPRQEPHGVRAVRWAQAMQEAAREMGIGIGVGIATGAAREGFIGVRRRMQPTVIGDVVNLASRLQDLTKEVGAPVLMDEATFSQAAAHFSLEPRGAVRVRGREKPVSVYSPKEAEK